MRRVVKVCLVMATAALIWAPAQARADGYVSPWIGANTGAGFETTLFPFDADNGHTQFGVNAGYMGAGIIGGEVDFGFSPSFFGPSDVFGTNNALNLMGNVIVGYPVGGMHGGSVRPYGTAGLGLMRSHFEAGVLNPFDSSHNEWGWNVGAGVMGFFSEHWGVRGDVRYLRTFEGEPDVLDLDFNPGGFHYWRTFAGVVIR